MSSGDTYSINIKSCTQQLENKYSGTHAYKEMLHVRPPSEPWQKLRTDNKGTY